MPLRPSPWAVHVPVLQVFYTAGLLIQMLVAAVDVLMCARHAAWSPLVVRALIFGTWSMAVRVQLAMQPMAIEGLGS